MTDAEWDALSNGLADEKNLQLRELGVMAVPEWVAQRYRDLLRPAKHLKLERSLNALLRAIWRPRLAARDWRMGL